MRKNLIDELNDYEMYVDSIDDAIDEIEILRWLLERAKPFVDDMVGIASAARPLSQEIEMYFNEED